MQNRRFCQINSRPSWDQKTHRSYKLTGLHKVEWEGPAARRSSMSNHELLMEARRMIHHWWSLCITLSDACTFSKAMICYVQTLHDRKDFSWNCSQCWRNWQKKRVGFRVIVNVWSILHQSVTRGDKSALKTTRLRRSTTIWSISFWPYYIIFARLLATGDNSTTRAFVFDNV